MSKIHFENDFEVPLVLSGMNVDYIDHIKFYTKHKNNHYCCSYNCNNLMKLGESKVTAFLDNHKLECGVLRLDVVFKIPDSYYPDGYQKVCQHYNTEVELVRENSEITVADLTILYNESVQELISTIESKADLVDGKVPESQLPDYIDDVIEFRKFVTGSGYLQDVLAMELGETAFCSASQSHAGNDKNKFMINTDGTQSGIEYFNPEYGKLYINQGNDKIYRWSGSNLVEVAKSVSLGESSTTAYAGNKGKQNAEDIQVLQSRFRHYTYPNELPSSDVENGTIALVDYGGLKQALNCTSNDFVYGYYANSNVGIGGARTMVTIYLVNDARIIYVPANSIIQAFNRNNNAMTIYFNGVWQNSGNLEFLQGEGYFIECDDMQYFPWLYCYTQKDCIFIYNNGWKQMVNANDVYTKQEVDQLISGL